jgi:alkanesulfonate monooxygenase SsuD/methylene tetrahydromethanopterin reductase-like flavin-dependent oxidoreductase (luciferase family)
MTILAATCLPQVPPEQVRAVARAAQDTGLAELWLWEDCFWGGGMSLASAILAWTDRLPVAIGVLPVPLRNVALTAMEAAALQRLFPGRITIGVGHGVQGWMGQVGARAASPLTLLGEYLRALRGLLDGERLTVDGRYVKLEDVALGWPPAAAPPLFAAATGPRTLQLSGRYADGTILDSATTTPDKLREARRLLDAAGAAAGRARPHQIVLYLLTVTGPDAARRLAAMGRDGTAAVAGGAEAVAEAVRFWGRTGADKVVLHPDAADPDPVAFIRFAAEQVQPLLGLGEPAACVRVPAAGLASAGLVSAAVLPAGAVGVSAVGAVAGARLRLLAVRGGEPVVDQRHHRGQERGHHSARHQVGDEAAEAARQEEQDRRQHDLPDDEDQEHHDVGAEHVPGVAADRPPAPAERLERAAAADHDLWHDQRPERQQDQAGHDDQGDPDRDADAGEDRGHRDRADERRRRRQGGAQVKVDPPVAHVLHGLHQRRLEQVHARQAEDQPEKGAEATERPAEQRVDDRDDEVDRE